MSSEFKIDTLVWAKLASYPYWPGRVTRLKDVRDKEIREQLGEQEQPGNELIWFFGTKNYGWVSSSMVVPYDDGYDEKAKNKRAKALKGFLAALKEAEAWKTDRNGDNKEDERDREDSKKEEKGKKKEEEEEKRRKKEEKKEKKKEEERKKEEEKKKRRESEVVRKKEEKRVEERRHSEPGERARKSEGVEEKPASKKRKASEEEEEVQTHKRAKVAESTPKKEKKRDEKRTSATPKEEKMETESAVTVVDGEKEAKSVEKMDTESPVKKQIPPHVMKGLLMLARHPVSKYHKLEFVAQSDGVAVAKALFSDARPSSKYEVHAVLGAAYFLVDVTCYAALLSSLREGDSAITQDIHVTVLAPIPQGNEVSVKAKVVSTKPKAGLVFLDGEVWCGQKLMATARVVKSLIEPDLPVKESTKEEKEKDRKENNNQSP